MLESMTSDDENITCGPSCPSCGGAARAVGEMIALRRGADRSGWVRMAWRCGGCGIRFEDAVQARRNAFARMAVSRLLDTARWLARHAAWEGDDVLFDAAGEAGSPGDASC
jgi:hypothetical protein